MRRLPQVAPVTRVVTVEPAAPVSVELVELAELFVTSPIP